MANKDQSRKKDLRYIRAMEAAKNAQKDFITARYSIQEEAKAWIEERMAEIELRRVQAVATVLENGGIKNDVKEILGVKDWATVTKLFDEAKAYNQQFTEHLTRRAETIDGKKTKWVLDSADKDKKMLYVTNALTDEKMRFTIEAINADLPTFRFGAVVHGDQARFSPGQVTYAAENEKTLRMLQAELVPLWVREFHDGDQELLNKLVNV